MTRPGRVQLRRAKGWRMPENTVSVARPTKWGNPFTIGTDGTAAECVELYARLLTGFIALGKSMPATDLDVIRRLVLADIAELRGKNLACWCAPGKPCHAEILLDLANA